MVTTVGVLALQGGVEEHIAVLGGLGVTTRRVRLPQDLDGLDGIILPGGESSAIDKLARSCGVAEPLRQTELPVLATCAGLIYSARELDNPAPGQQTLALIDVSVRRNAFGNQRFSEERIVPVAMGMEMFEVEASFIRAPIVTRVGEGVEVIATVPVSGLVAESLGRDVDGQGVGQKSSLDAGGEAVVGVRQGNVTALSFHPEENGDSRLHAAWLASL
ncbi:pyridoxal 5'-phosphate synthase glutaminase subunit PdxT [Corynebacterium minutissimum]|uniref:Pyridoxal 5'-phosphate synthase subunit PdxT n=1 Tax=Corynebacterium minutissimum TaxID=38301 RepID=A0A2X4REM5_9CORY|nr:pyridoxal 5'-phosphate synthase glutaminase subunit PdxT [Corynebacterium minutissimum]KHO29964.1 glutamine amidotransferase [Corynebacterium minutissimum]QPS60443.1 pyridoxal 5'-phosphate synthase glutaminase subunit PdxT [Corynebacterium minutissimum]QQA78768.1 pyridoxal 5'-phosphate synthase glutaminase subunit PdxT [Corynebacterium minutissimum]SQI00706.1 glutamine amidotransferase subunit PdxT [Corynebacterium minutissimum]VEG05226.1 glutamine amidotransferase subunit PdxT [Corynebacte